MRGTLPKYLESSGSCIGHVITRYKSKAEEAEAAWKKYEHDYNQELIDGPSLEKLVKLGPTKTKKELWRWRNMNRHAFMTETGNDMHHAIRFYSKLLERIESFWTSGSDGNYTLVNRNVIKNANLWVSGDAPPNRGSKIHNDPAGMGDDPVNAKYLEEIYNRKRSVYSDEHHNLVFRLMNRETYRKLAQELGVETLVHTDEETQMDPNVSNPVEERPVILLDDSREYQIEMKKLEERFRDKG